MIDEPTYPNERDCEHGHLRRKCEICELERENKRLRAALELIADKGGTYCADEETAITCNGSWCAEQARRALENTKLTGDHER